MDFDSMFSAFVNWQTIVLCLSIYLLTHGIRRIIETIFVSIKNNRYWNEIALPLLPIINGVIIGIIPIPFPWPLNMATFALAKIMYGSICGLFSGWVYNRVKAWLASSAPGGSPPSDPENSL